MYDVLAYTTREIPRRALTGSHTLPHRASCIGASFLPNPKQQHRWLVVAIFVQKESTVNAWKDLERPKE